jgi:hypothetical protein
MFLFDPQPEAQALYAADAGASGSGSNERQGNQDQRQNHRADCHPRNPHRERVVAGRANGCSDNGVKAGHRWFSWAKWTFLA